MTDASPSTESVSARWRAAAEKALKGQPLESITWRFEDGFELPAMATAEDSSDLPHLVVPRGATGSFLSVCSVYAAEEEQAIDDALGVLDQGFDRIAFVLGEGMAVGRLLDELPAGSALVRAEEATATDVRDLVLAREDGTPWVLGTHLDGVAPAQQCADLLRLLVLALRSADPESLVPRLVLELPVGPEILTEIAKVRAMRLLADKVTHAFGVDDRVSLLAHQSLHHDTRLEPHTNLLRATLAGVAGVVGGAELIELTPFDSFEQDPPSDSTRLAVNQLRLLTDESFLDRVADPAGGSHAIEAATHGIASTAWGYLQALEAAGLLTPDGDDPVAALEQLGVEETEALRVDGVRRRERVVVGINRFADPALDTDVGPSLDPGLDYADEEGYLDETNFALRAALPFEWLRDRVLWFQEEGGRRPGMQAIAFGPRGLSRARAEFANDFFRAGGFRAEETERANDVGEAVELADDSDAAVFVLCGPDDAYAAFVPAFVQGLRAAGSEALVYAAGPPPEDAADLGLTAWVHRGSDAFDLLCHALDVLGIARFPAWAVDDDGEEASA